MVICTSESNGTLVSVNGHNGDGHNDDGGRKCRHHRLDGCDFQQSSASSVFPQGACAALLEPTALYLPSSSVRRPRRRQQQQQKSSADYCFYEESDVIGDHGDEEEKLPGYVSTASCWGSSSGSSSESYDSDCDDDDDDLLFLDPLEEGFHGQQERLYLPADRAAGGREDLLPVLPGCLEETRRQLLFEAPVLHLSNEDAAKQKKQKQPSYLYVCQREVAHAVPHQCDYLVTDRATTCHVLALHSTTMNASGTSSSGPTTPPLTSLCHLDGPGFDSCVRDMVEEHARHHNHQSDGNSTVLMDVHVVGGFDDPDGTSQELTTWLLGLLADIAGEYSRKETLRMTLRTFAATIHNTDTSRCCDRGGPICRGVAVDTTTGEVRPARVDRDAMGPCTTLREVRLMLDGGGKDCKLSLVHDQRSNFLRVDPVVHDPAACPGLVETARALLSIRDDDVLLAHTSTSPDYEDRPDFCTSIRDCLALIVAGIGVPRGLKFRRRVVSASAGGRRDGGIAKSGNNQWRQVGTLF